MDENEGGTPEEVVASALEAWKASEEFTQLREKVEALAQEFYPNAHLEAIRTGLRNV